MNLRAALKEQYHAGLAMLDECVEKCPHDLWLEGTHPRTYWRIAWHTLYFTHNYLLQNAEDFDGSVENWPPTIRATLGVKYPQRAIDVEPYELPPDVTSLAQGEIRAYIAYVDGLVDSTVDGLDLDTQESGFPWYENISKLSHQLMNLRHIQGHVGQLSELLMARGIDIDWVAKATSYAKKQPLHGLGVSGVGRARFG